MRRRRVSVARLGEKVEQSEETKSGKENDEEGTLEDFYDTEVMVFNHSSEII
jgi:hypothetical protein